MGRSKSIGVGTTLNELLELQSAYGDTTLLQELGEGPYLIVFPWADSAPGGLVDTALALEDTDDLHAIRETTRARASAVGHGGPGEAYLLQVAKTARNPFAQLVTLGRARNNDLILSSASVSKVHAWFLDGGPSGWFLQDNGSTNGTTHNDEPVRSGDNVALRRGDLLGFGGVQAVFESGPGTLEFARRRC